MRNGLTALFAAVVVFGLLGNRVEAETETECTTRCGNEHSTCTSNTKTSGSSNLKTVLSSLCDNNKKTCDDGCATSSARQLQMRALAEYAREQRELAGPQDHGGSSPDNAPVSDGRRRSQNDGDGTSEEKDDSDTIQFLRQLLMRALDDQ